MKQLIKSLIFPGGKRPRAVVGGAGKGIQLNVDPADQSQRLLGLAEAEISAEFVDFATRCRTFADVGASDGWYALLARKYNRNVRIIAFEPDASLAAEAQEHFRLNGLVQDESIKWIPDFCGTKGVPLDDVLKDAPEPIFLKIDIEGGELDALTSGTKTIEQKRCLIIVETHSQDMEIRCRQFLEDRSYRVRIISKGWYRTVIPELRPIEHNRWFVAERA